MSNPEPRGLRANVALDLATARHALPFGRQVIPLIALGSAAGFGFLRPGYSSIYGESLLLIVLLFAFGALGRTLGTLAVFAYGAADMVRFVVGPDRFSGEPSVLDAFGRLISYAVLWALVVYVPSIARRLEWQVESRRDRGLLGRFAATAVGAAIAGIGAYLWANVMPYLFRGVYGGSPDPATLQPQQHPELLALAVAATYCLVVAFLRRGPVNPVELAPLLALPRTGLSGLTVRILAYSLLVLGLSGVISGTFDVGILIAGFVVAEAGAWLVGRRGLRGVGEGRSPAVISGAGAVAAVIALLVVGWVANAIWPQGIFARIGPVGLVQSRFWPIILALAVAWPIARIGFSLAARVGRDATIGNPGTSAAVPAAVSGIIGVLLALLLVVATLLMPAVALADNCGTLADCFYMAFFVATMGGFGAGLLAAANALSPPHAPDSVPSTDPRLKDFNKRDEKPSGLSDRFNNIRRGGNDFMGGGY